MYKNKSKSDSETLNYIRAMTCELRDLASSSREEMLVYLLDMAREEADRRLLDTMKKSNR